MRPDLPVLGREHAESALGNLGDRELVGIGNYRLQVTQDLAL